ncbi:hypothetical protein [Bradyrhizobium ottawaense]|uniref:hypothetical protein n=1 Tax=Bradyrhizobium ottawaense TaxID=931866 RepID=UPI003F9F4DB0
MHFGGYDSAIEASFFIEEDALRRLRPGCHDERGFLDVFDCNRDVILCRGR